MVGKGLIRKFIYQLTYEIACFSVKVLQNPMTLELMKTATTTILKLQAICDSFQLRIYRTY
jgi:hypothetical protein